MNREDFACRQPGLIGESHFAKYAILVPLVRTPEGISLLLERRSHKLRRQPREICFPGGRIEPDETPQMCAVRETSEELFLTAGQVEILGPGDIFISPHNLIIHPFIGVIRDYRGTFNTDEVADVLSIPLKFFQEHNPEKYKVKLVSELPDDFPYDRIPGGEKYPWATGTYHILFYRHEQDIIWGLTAQILKSAVELIDEYGLSI